jgi:hypothetical protein
MLGRGELAIYLLIYLSIYLSVDLCGAIVPPLGTLNVYA